MTDPEASVLAAQFNHHDPAQAADPYPTFGAVRSSGCPVARSESNGGFWLITRYDDVNQVLHDPATFSSWSVNVPRDQFKDYGLPSFPPINLDGDEHRDFRRIVLPAFSPKTLLAWEGAARAACREFVDAVAGRGACDASWDFARRVPIRVIALLVGIPPEDEITFASWIHDLTNVGPDNIEQALAASHQMHEYFERQIEEHIETPRGDLLSILLEAEYEGRRLTRQELVGFLDLMVLAGMDTTWGVLGAILWHLAQHPEERHYLAADPARIPNAVEEYLRYFAPALIGRVAMRDVELNGSRISSGESVLLCFPSANRDEAAFEGADQVVLDRDPIRHSAFGVGVHRCLGATLARMELRVALEEWLARIPDFVLENPESVQWCTGQVRGPRTVPIRFPPST